MSSKETINDAIENYNIRPKKSKGQNFLNNDSIIEKIVNECGAEKLIIEIGPGTGVMTEKLAKKYAKVICIEIDDDLLPFLSEKFNDMPNVEIIHNDALKVNFDKIIEESGFDSATVCANIPYYISTPLLEKILLESNKLNRVVMMVQKEFADKVLQKSGTRECVPLSYLVEYKSKGEKCFNIAPNNFTPPPKVTSTVIKLDIRKNEILALDEKFLYKMIKTAFNQRRKKASNTLSTIVDKNKIPFYFEKAGIDIDARGEEIDINAFCRLENIIKMEKNNE